MSFIHVLTGCSHQVDVNTVACKLAKSIVELSQSIAGSKLMQGNAGKIPGSNRSLGRKMSEYDILRRSNLGN